MRRLKIAAIVLPLLVLMAFGASAMANGGSSSFGAKLRGYEETPAINSSGTGQFSATLASSGFTYTLSYSGLTSTALFAHIHFGQRGVAGGVAAFLCGGGGKPACPPAGGTVTGTITAADVVAIPTQNLAAGDLASLLKAIRAGVAYVNVHTTNFPSGEIRGQIRFQEEDED